jgi:hypothetical protein
MFQLKSICKHQITEISKKYVDFITDESQIEEVEELEDLKETV